MPPAHKRNHRRFQFGLGAMFVLVAILAIWFGVFFRPRPFPYAFPDPEKQIQDVELLLGPDHAASRLSSTDPDKVNSMISKPFHRRADRPTTCPLRFIWDAVCALQ